MLISTGSDEVTRILLNGIKLKPVSKLINFFKKHSIIRKKLFIRYRISYLALDYKCRFKGKISLLVLKRFTSQRWNISKIFSINIIQNKSAFINCCGWEITLLVDIQQPLRMNHRKLMWLWYLKKKQLRVVRKIWKIFRFDEDRLKIRLQTLRRNFWEWSRITVCWYWYLDKIFRLPVKR